MIFSLVPFLSCDLVAPNWKLPSPLLDTGYSLGGACSRSREHPRSEEKAQGSSRPEGTTGAAQPDGQVHLVDRAFYGALLSTFDVK